MELPILEQMVSGLSEVAASVRTTSVLIIGWYDMALFSHLMFPEDFARSFGMTTRSSLQIGTISTE